MRIKYLSYRGNIKKVAENYALKLGCEYKSIEQDSLSLYPYSVIVSPYFFPKEARMSVKVANVYIALGIAAILLGAIFTVFTITQTAYGYGTFRLFIWLFIGGPYSIYVGRKGKKDNNWKEYYGERTDKVREFAVFLTLIPGLGHFYLRRRKSGAAVFSLTLLLMTTMVLSLMLRIENNIDEDNFVMLFIVYGIITWAFAAFWAYLDIEKIRIEEGIPFSPRLILYDSPQEYGRIDGYKRTTFLVAVSTLVLIGVASLATGYGSPYISTFVVSASVVAAALYLRFAN
jgi:hypothetical protein